VVIKLNYQRSERRGRLVSSRRLLWVGTAAAAGAAASIECNATIITFGYNLRISNSFSDIAAAAAAGRTKAHAARSAGGGALQ
jgi:hypothetical protein